MTFAARAAAQIRDTALANWRARYLLLSPPRDLDISEGSDAYNEIDALSQELEGLELGAQEAAHRVLLRYATGTDLDLFAEDDGTARKAASKARRTVTITGPATTTAPIGGASLSAANGLRWVPINADTGAILTDTPTTDGSGNATMTVEAAAPGVAPNELAVGSVLTWSSAPTGFAATADLGAVTVAGQNAESDAALQARLLLRRRERPGGGNRSWWHEQLVVVAGVEELFVYRVMTAEAVGDVFDYVPNRAGNITVMPFAPKPSSYAESGDGMVAEFSRIPTTEVLDRVRGYLRGTLDKNGNTPGTGIELYPAHMTEDHFYVVPPRAYVRNVVLSVRAGAGWRWPTEANTVGAVGSTSTVVVCNAAIVEWRAGDRIAFADWSGHRVRGGWFLRRITHIDPGSNAVTLDTALPSAPPAATVIRPDAGNAGGASLWEAIRLTVADDVFDNLGPGSAPSQSFRYPEEERTRYPAPHSKSALLRAVLNVEGVEDGSVDTPSASETAPIGGLFVLGNLRVDQMP